jgi:GMP synthase (glutamine-hydrolysing)
MRKLLVFQHVPLEPLGTLNQQFKESGFRIRYVNFDREPDARIDPGRYNGLVILGGPMAADETDRHPHLEYEREIIRQAAALGLPTLGICLGAQLIAAAVGGSTLRGAAPEYGWVEIQATPDGCDDPLFRHFEGSAHVYQWHSDTFSLPPGAVHLAESPTCPMQAFRIQEHIYGLQFHLEADRRLIRRWVAAPHHVEELARRGTVVELASTLADCDRWLPRASRLGRAVFGEFIGRFYGFRRRRALKSR